MSSKPSPQSPTKSGTSAATHPPSKQEIIPAGHAPPDKALSPIATLQPSLQAQVLSIDALAYSYSAALAQATGGMQRAILLAQGIVALRAAITPEVLAPFMSLYNTANGFKADRGPGQKNPTPYSEEVVRECLITSFLMGVLPTGNEWNILSGQCYITVNGYKRKLENIPGISDISVVPGSPAAFENNAVKVRVGISWRLGGIFNQLTDPDGKPGQVFTIPAAPNHGPDLVIGKAKRRAYKAAFEKATGSVCFIDEESHEQDFLPPTKQQALPGGGTSRTQQTQALFLDKMRQEIGERLAKLRLDEEAWFAISEKLAVPANINSLDQKQAAEVIGWLQVEELRIEDELREEREAMRLG